MLIKDYLPNPSFSEFVQWYRIVHFEFDNLKQPPLKAYPPKPETVLHFFIRGGIEVINGCNHDYQHPIMLAGQQTSVVNRYCIGRETVNLQIVFQPSGLFRLIGIPSFELTNRYVD